MDQDVGKIQQEITGQLGRVLQQMPSEKGQRSPARAVQRVRDEILAEYLPGMLSKRLDKLERMQPITRQPGFVHEAIEAMNSACRLAGQYKLALKADPDVDLPKTALHSPSVRWEGFTAKSVAVPWAYEFGLAATQLAGPWWQFHLSEDRYEILCCISFHASEFGSDEAQLKRMETKIEEEGGISVLLVEEFAAHLIAFEDFANNWYNRTVDWFVAWNRPRTWVLAGGEGVYTLARPRDR